MRQDHVWKTTVCVALCALVLLALTGCETLLTRQTTDLSCTAYRPITYDSRTIDADLARQLREHNAVWQEICGPT